MGRTAVDAAGTGAKVAPVRAVDTGAAARQKGSTRGVDEILSLQLKLVALLIEVVRRRRKSERAARVVPTELKQDARVTVTGRMFSTMARTEAGSKGKRVIALFVLLLWAVASTASAPSFQAGAAAAAVSSFDPASHARTGLPAPRAVDAVDHRGVAVSQQHSDEPAPAPTTADGDSGCLPPHAFSIVPGRHVAAPAFAPAAARVAALRTADARAPPFHS